MTRVVTQELAPGIGGERPPLGGKSLPTLFDETLPTGQPRHTIIGERLIFRCTVIGNPVPQGSAKAFMPRGWKRPIVTSDNKRLRPWRNIMATTFLEAVEATKAARPMFCGPVIVSATFLMGRTKSLPKTREKPHTVKPDLDKLLRALCDALTEGCVLADDSLIVEYGRLVKRYALVGEAPGVTVEVRAS